MHNLFLQTSPRNASGKCSSCPKRNICRVKICSPAPLDNLGTVGTHGIAPVTSIVTPIVCRLNRWVTLLGTITYPLPALPAFLSRWFSGFLHVGYVSSLEDNRFFFQLKMDESLWWISCHVISVLLFCSKSSESIQFTQYGESRSIFPNHEPASLIHIWYVYIIILLNIISPQVSVHFHKISTLLIPATWRRSPALCWSPNRDPWPHGNTHNAWSFVLALVLGEAGSKGSKGSLVTFPLRNWLFLKGS